MLKCPVLDVAAVLIIQQQLMINILHKCFAAHIIFGCVDISLIMSSPIMP